MSGSPNGGQGNDVVLQEEKCKMDNNLEVKPAIKSWKLGARDESENPVSSFPYLITFINLACVVYMDHNGASLTESKNHGNTKSSAGRIFDKCQKIFKRNNVFENKNVETKAMEEEDQEQTANELTKLGFVFLAEARNNSNGYRGVAYVHKNKRQVVLSHRGTKPSNLGAIWVDTKNIWWGAYTSHLSSAITFAYHVAQFAVHNNCQLFFTGHSLGAWLAQITCFSTKYLKLCTSTGRFVRKRQSEWDSIHPYTVAFDSPGALEFLQRMKKDLIMRNDATSQMQVNVECLPVEVYQFYTNTVNFVNTQIGSVFLVNLENAKVSYTYVRWGVMDKSVTFQTHSITPVRNFLSNEDNESEERVLESQVLDWRVENWDDFLHKWKNEGRSVKVELHIFAEYFLTRKELDLLKELRKKEDGGCYEGLFSEDEEVANRLVEYCKRGGAFVEGCVQLGENLDRRDAIPQVRQFAQALKNKVIWWNPTKMPVPENYIRRSVAETRHFESGGRLPSSVPQKRLDEMIEPLVLVVDPPGMGKSTEMSYLDQQLRVKVSSNRVILRLNLNQVQMALSKLSLRESASRILLKLAPFLPANIFETGGVRVSVLLDGLDEVCPAHQTTMINLLRLLNSSREESMHSLCVFVTTRPHLRGAVEDEFKLKSSSLLPLTGEEQNQYMKSVLKKSSEEISGIRSKLTESVSGLLGIPLMLSMFVDVIKSGGDFAGRSLNVFDLYEKFMKAKHVVYLVEKRGAKEEDNYTQMDLTNIPKRSLPFYYRAAINRLVDREKNRERIFTECRGIVAQEEPSELTRRELLSLGLLIEGSGGRLVFKHLSFAEFFYAMLLTAEDPLPQGARDILFGNIYASSVLKNVEAFVAASLLSKTPPPTTLPVPSLLLSLSPNWILTPEASYGRGRMFREFLKSSHLFPLLVREVLLTCINDDARDLWQVHEILFDEVNIQALRGLCLWMSENREWTRGELLKIDQVRTTPTTTRYPLAVARLMVVIGLHVEGQALLSEEEVGLAINRCDRRLVSIVAMVPTGRLQMNKWDWVEGHLSRGGEQTEGTLPAGGR